MGKKDVKLCVYTRTELTARLQRTIRQQADADETDSYSCKILNAQCHVILAKPQSKSSYTINKWRN